MIFFGQDSEAARILTISSNKLRTLNLEKPLNLLKSIRIKNTILFLQSHGHRSKKVKRIPNILRKSKKQKSSDVWMKTKEKCLCTRSIKVKFKKKDRLFDNKPLRLYQTFNSFMSQADSLKSSLTQKSVYVSEKYNISNFTENTNIQGGMAPPPPLKKFSSVSEFSPISQLRPRLDPPKLQIIPTVSRLNYWKKIQTNINLVSDSVTSPCSDKSQASRGTVNDAERIRALLDSDSDDDPSLLGPTYLLYPRLDSPLETNGDMLTPAVTPSDKSRATPATPATPPFNASENYDCVFSTTSLVDSPIEPMFSVIPGLDNGTKSKLTNVMRRTRKKPYKCQQCDTSCTSPSALKIHMRTHSGEKPYICQECDKGFIQTGNLNKHMRTHTGEKPYACQQCDKSFIESSHLKRHMKTHTVIRALLDSDDDDEYPSLLGPNSLLQPCLDSPLETRISSTNVHMLSPAVTALHSITPSDKSRATPVQPATPPVNAYEIDDVDLPIEPKFSVIPGLYNGDRRSPRSDSSGREEVPSVSIKKEVSLSVSQTSPHVSPSSTPLISKSFSPTSFRSAPTFLDQPSLDTGLEERIETFTLSKAQFDNLDSDCSDPALLYYFEMHGKSKTKCLFYSEIRGNLTKFSN